MRRSLLLALVIVATALTAGGEPSAAQDPVAAGPHAYKVLLDNPRIRMLKLRLEPGKAVPVHSHPDHAAYVLAGGTLEINHVGASSKRIELNPGDTAWIPEEIHSIKNVGRTTLELVSFELKERPPGTEEAR